MNCVERGVALTDHEQILVYNKVDRLTHAEEQALQERVKALGIEALFVSAVNPQSLGPLREALKERLRARLQAVRVDLPAMDGEALAAIYREGEVLSRQDRDSVVELTARVPPSLLGRLRQRVGIRIQHVA